jgi:hypothetical protein
VDCSVFKVQECSLTQCLNHQSSHNQPVLKNSLSTYCFQRFNSLYKICKCGLVGKVAYTADRRGTCRGLMGIPEGKTPLDLGIHERLIQN